MIDLFFEGAWLWLMLGLLVGTVIVFMTDLEKKHLNKNRDNKDVL